MWVPNSTDPGVLVAYVYPGAGSTVYVYGWTYAYIAEGRYTYAYDPVTRVFTYEVQFDSKANAINFVNAFKDLLQTAKNYVNNNELSFDYLYNFFSPDNNEYASLSSFIQDYGGIIESTSFPYVISESGYSELGLDVVASAIKDLINNQINPELGVQLPDDVVYLDTVRLNPEGVPSVGGIIVDEDYNP